MLVRPVNSYRERPFRVTVVEPPLLSILIVAREVPRLFGALNPISKVNFSPGAKSNCIPAPFEKNGLGTVGRLPKSRAPTPTFCITIDRAGASFPPRAANASEEGVTRNTG